jgi:hypothetical protein
MAIVKITFLEAENERLRERVEKAEKGNKFVGEIDAIVLASQGKHVTPFEMIDAAWKHVTETSDGYIAGKIAMALEELGVKECKGGPSPATECVDGRMADPHHGRMDPCPYCKGKEWVIEGEDDDGTCPGCGEIIQREDYERGECHWCGREVGDE